MRKVCVKDGKTFYQCPGSRDLYEVQYKYNDYQRLSTACSKDTYHYTACYLPSFTPLLFNNTVVAVCGHYVCENRYGNVYSGESVTSITWCDNRVQCYNGGVDEMYCTEEEKKKFFHVSIVLAPAHLKCVMESVTVTTTVKMSGSVVGITTTTGTRAVTQAIQYLLLISVITIQTVVMVMMRATARKEHVSGKDILIVLTN